MYFEVWKVAVQTDHKNTIHDTEVDWISFTVLKVTTTALFYIYSMCKQRERTVWGMCQDNMIVLKTSNSANTIQVRTGKSRDVKLK